MVKKVLYITGCAIGGGLIGCFANKLDTPIGIALFAVGVVLLTASAYIYAKRV